MKALILAVLFGLARAWAATLVAPNGFENVEGNSTGIPLFGGDNTRTQVIYSAAHFSLFPPEGAYLVELRFRVDGQNQSFAGSADLELRMSTTHANPNSLSPLFSSNIGTDEAVVLPRTTLQLSGSGNGGGGPNSFSVVIPLPNRFLYNPNNGNLLVDARVYGIANLNNLDWQSSQNDGVSVAGGNVTSSLGAVSNNGLVTEFVIEPVPEPGTIILFGIGSLTIALMRGRHVTS